MTRELWLYVLDYMLPDINETVQKTAVIMMAVLLLSACTVPHIPQRPDRVQYALSVLALPPIEIEPQMAPTVKAIQ